MHHPIPHAIVRARTAAAAPLAAFSKEVDPSLAALRARRGAAVSASAEDEAARKKRDGTPVTKDAFFAWRDKFEREMAAAAAAALAAAAAGGKSGGAGTGGAAAGAAASSAAFTGLPFLPSGPILDEKGKPKLTGKQLFESDATLATSDAALLTESDAEAAAAGSSVAAGGAAAAGGDGAGTGEFVVDASLYLDGADLDDLEGLDDDDDEEDEDDDEDEVRAWDGGGSKRRSCVCACARWCCGRCPGRSDRDPVPAWLSRPSLHLACCRSGVATTTARRRRMTRRRVAGLTTTMRMRRQQQPLARAGLVPKQHQRQPQQAASLQPRRLQLRQHLQLQQQQEARAVPPLAGAARPAARAASGDDREPHL